MPLLPKHFPVTCHTDHVGPGSTFVAIKGNRADGNTFIQKAKKRGATNIVQTTQARKALAELSAQALGHPAQKLKLIAITGTKGKTTVTHMVSHLLRHSGIKVAHLSSHDNRILDASEPSRLTTPSADYVQMFLSVAAAQGVTHVVMEASSHGIAQHRLHGLTFDAIGFTNLGHDHLDYHQTMKQYFADKCHLFKQCKPTGAIIINSDDPWGRKIAHHQAQAFGTDMDHAATKLFIEKACQAHGLQISLANRTYANQHLFGTFNAYNAALAISICDHLELTTEQLQDGFANFTGVPGRQQKITLASGTQVIIDFAHNPSAMEAILNSLRPATKDLIVVFGAGGNRDQEKRPLMGKIAATHANQIILTSDNPRDEDPMQIINDIKSGITVKENLHIEPNRKLAIGQSLGLAAPQSIVALLGKGAETWMEAGGNRTRFSDKEEVERWLKNEKIYINRQR